MDQALQTEDNTKKRNYLQYYLDTQHNFTPLVFSVEEYMGRENQAEIKVNINSLKEETSFPYLGRTITHNHSDWEALYSNLRKF